jgi:subtilisin family serine protease
MALLWMLLSAVPGAARAQVWIESEAVAKVEPGVDIDSFAINHSLTVLDRIESRSIAVFLSNTYMSTEELLIELNEIPEVIYAEPHLIMEDPEAQQKSEAFVDLTHPEFIDEVSPELFFGQSARGQINLDQAHDLATGLGAVAAVLDNGVDLLHPSLSQNLAANPYAAYDYVDNDSIPAEEQGGEAYGHGTFVSSMIRMVAPDAAILPLRVLDSNGQGSLLDVAEAIYYAASLEVDVINLSLGTLMENQTLTDAIAFADSMGVCCVASVGNRNSSSESYPAACYSVPGITAVDSNDIKAEYASYGDWVELSAPGVEIYGALADGEFGWWSGTSFSAALVSGTVALLRSAQPNLSPSAIRTLLSSTAEDIDDLNPEYLGQLGSGRLNCSATLSAIPNGGDVNGSGTVDIDDIVYLVGYIFADGPPPEPFESGDTDCSGGVDIDDVVHLIGYIFSGGSAPCDTDGDGVPDC